MRDYEEIMKELVEAVRDQCSDECTLFELEINYQGVSWRLHTRTAGDLRAEGISMRNLKGDFIK